MKQFIFEIKDFVDTDFLHDKVMQIFTREWAESDDATALANFTDNENYYINVENNTYLKSIRAKYPKLKPYIKILKSEKGIWPAHVDTWRQTAINIPIKNYNNCLTHFYDSGIEVQSMESSFGSRFGTWYSNDYVKYIEPGKLIFSHKLLYPTLVNTSKPHSIANSSDDTRIIASWTYDSDYYTAVEELSNA